MALPYLNHIAPSLQAAFESGVRAMASRLGIQPDWAMTVMYRESGLKATAHNPSGATGLIQFLPSTAKDVGTTTAALARMNAVQQLPYVERYYRSMIVSTGVRPRSVYDLYLLTLYPKAAGKSDTYVVFRRGTTAYAQNSSINPSGDVTVADIKHFVDGITPGTVTTAATVLSLSALAIGALVFYVAYKSVNG